MQALCMKETTVTVCALIGLISLGPPFAWKGFAVRVAPRSALRRVSRSALVPCSAGQSLASWPSGLAVGPSRSESLLVSRSACRGSHPAMTLYSNQEVLGALLVSRDDALCESGGPVRFSLVSPWAAMTLYSNLEVLGALLESP